MDLWLKFKARNSKIFKKKTLVKVDKNEIITKGLYIKRLEN